LFEEVVAVEIFFVEGSPGLIKNCFAETASGGQSRVFAPELSFFIAASVVIASVDGGMVRFCAEVVLQEEKIDVEGDDSIIVEVDLIEEIVEDGHITITGDS
jgi:hypothetical protein